MRSNIALGVTFLVLTLLGVGIASPYALLAVMFDGLRAAIIVGPPVLAGLWLAHWLVRDSDVPHGRASLPLRWHVLLGSALGLGCLSALILLLGLVGLLQRPLWIAILSILAIAGIVRGRALLARTRRAAAGERGPSAQLKDQTQPLSTGMADAGNRGMSNVEVRLPSEDRSGDSLPIDNRKSTIDIAIRRWRLLWLLACPFAVLALLAASNAPGFVWQEEGFGYDVLEYHLQLPKEYFHAGRIAYVPHNVYANFPANVEMLYLLAMIVHDDVYDIGVTANMIHMFFAALTVFAAWVAGREWSRLGGIVCAVSMATAGWLAYLCGLAYVENGMLFFGMAAAALLLRRGVITPGIDAARGTEPVCGTDFPVGRETGSNTAHRRSIALAGVLAGLACGCKYTAFPLIAAPLVLATLLQAGRSIQKKLGDAAVFAVAVTVACAPWLLKNQVMTGNPVFPLANSVFRGSPPGWGDKETQRWDKGHDTQAQQRTLDTRFVAAWNHIAADKYQRFGPAIIVIALAGLFGRRRQRVDLVLIVLLITQLGIWLFATHLFARFAVVLLIPLALLCGRAVTGADGKVRLYAIAAALVVGCAWNLAFAARLHKEESSGGAPASLIYDGEIPGFEYFQAVNHELPKDARILLVGDAKAFYFQRDVDYCVTFNRNPFFAAARTAESAGELLHWLGERGYSHVLVNWSEVGRLSETYGFSPDMDSQTLEDVFEALAAAGLSRIRAFPHPHTGDRYVDLYEVP